MNTQSSELKQNGFTLVELTIVVLILGIIFISFSNNMGAIGHVQKIKQSQNQLKTLKTEFLTFGKTHKYLPCPDTDNDGLENRTNMIVATETLDVCASSSGTVPYLTLGLQKEAITDSWNNLIRYAINTETTDGAKICDKRSSASFFCTLAADTTPWFNMTDTPPNSTDSGSGNYTICNQKTASCDASTTMQGIDLNTASIVLLAYNQDGSQTLNNCSEQNSATKENCDNDLYFHQSQADNQTQNFFDDSILAISGYEIKANLLANNINWDSYTSTSSHSGLTPTYEDFDLTADDNVPISNSPDEQDVILINRNMTTDLDLGGGDDYLAIGNNLASTDSNPKLDMGDGNDQLYIVGTATTSVYLGDGDDAFVLGTDMQSQAFSGDGNDKIWIQGNILEGYGTRRGRKSYILEMGNGDDILWVGNSEDSQSGLIQSNIRGNDGFDILVLEQISKSDYQNDSSLQSFVNEFELVIFKADNNGDREYLELN
ncbi:hypothetical protein THMIRHAS_07050 [Thiosulfatimonas sediminis]|uniref:Prepilin-type N-terminal cleavage/methylation domain-containing protein n=1 Tax=Thiosulfatimonas sediminis TaxID=2675054 RepID=A0A6F8PT66_9GAMM|nr:type II secretion system protein [Thiosulfatimonas sediminis]BBP45332.1 hypothetical protein THMIRHAS_07050 [Thiosulfatimonas sediminis]